MFTVDLGFGGRSPRALRMLVLLDQTTVYNMTAKR